MLGLNYSMAVFRIRNIFVVYGTKIGEIFQRVLNYLLLLSLTHQLECLGQGVPEQ
jgi:hypothetical protein